MSADDFSDGGDILGSIFHKSPLEKIDGFPTDAWASQLSVLNERKNWYMGYPLDETIEVVQKNGSKVQVERYPLKINPLRNTVKKMASVLIGQGFGSEDIDSQVLRVKATFEDEVNSSSDDTPKAEKVEDAISEIMEGSFQSEIISRAAVTSQYLGGAAFYLSYDSIKKDISISYVSSLEVLCIPSSKSMWVLDEAWIVKQISKSQAIGYGYKPHKREKKFFYVEKYTLDEHRFYVNSKEITSDSGKNFWGFVPIVYIPRTREEVFIGESIITETVKGIIKELNLRVADAGDATSFDTHANVVAGNLRTDPVIREVGTLPYIDIGSGSAMTGNSDKPFMDVLQTSSTMSATLKFIDNLMTMYRREVNHPAVADGEDTGSQRSSLTISTRMFPMVSDVSIQRRFWSSGFSQLSKYILRMCAKTNIYGITKELADPKLTIMWQPMMNRDRMELVNEAVQRYSVGLSSRRAMNKKLGDFMDEDDNFLDEVIDDTDGVDETNNQTDEENKGENNKKD